MKILHLLYDNPQNPWLGGGAALRAKGITEHFSKKSDQIYFISGGFPKSSATNSSDKAHHFFTPHFESYISSRLFFSLKAPSVIKKLK